VRVVTDKYSVYRSSNAFWSISGLHAPKMSTFSGSQSKPVYRLALCSAYRPQINGQAGRVNCTFLSLLRAMISQFKGNWETHQPTVVCDFNTTVHLATGFTAHFLPYGWHPTDIGVPSVFKILRIILFSATTC
jgi:hypothetical protein